MKRIGAAAIVLLIASAVMGQELGLWAPRNFGVPPFDRIQVTLPCEAMKPARVVAIGNGHSAIGIYVYDSKGHCVAFDDEPTPSIDDRVAEWMPTETGPFDVQIRNAGAVVNRVDATALYTTMR